MTELAKRTAILESQGVVPSFRSGQSMDIGDPLASTAVFGAGLMMDNPPTCPSGGTYTWGSAVPTVGTAYGTCSFTGPPTHVLGPTLTADW